MPLQFLDKHVAVFDVRERSGDESRRREGGEPLWVWEGRERGSRGGKSEETSENCELAGDFRTGDIVRWVGLLFG